jgi:hypothetical protein
MLVGPGPHLHAAKLSAISFHGVVRLTGNLKRITNPTSCRRQALVSGAR